MTDLPDRLRATDKPECVEYADYSEHYDESPPPFKKVPITMADACITALLDALEGET